MLLDGSLLEKGCEITFGAKSNGAKSNGAKSNVLDTIIV
jgi:hypothetical protein